MSEIIVFESAFLLDKADDYPAWVMYTTGLLRQKNCAWAIEKAPKITLESVRQELALQGFPLIDLMTGILVKSLNDRRDKQIEQLIRAESITQNQVSRRHSHFIANKGAFDMWTVLKERFQDLSPMNFIDVLFKLSRRAITEYKNATKYCAAYEKALNKISGMFSTNSNLTIKGAETIIQGFMLANVSETYAPLIAQIRRDWKSDHSDLTEVSRPITSYAGHTKEKSKALVVANSQKRNFFRILDGTCTVSECIAKGQTNHTKERCWTLHPELKAKRFQSTTVVNSESKRPAPVKPATQINS